MIKDGLDHDAVVTTIVGLWTDWKDARLEKEKIWSECLANYLVHVDKAKYENWPWRCQVADTFSQETADTIASAMRAALFPMNEDFYELEGVDAVGKLHAQAMKDYLDGLLHRMQFIERLMPAFKQLSVIGNCPILTPWTTELKSERRRVRTINPVTYDTTVSVQRIPQKKYDGPGLQVLDAFDVVFDPMSLCGHGTKIRRTLMTREAFVEKYGDYTDITELDAGTGKPMEPSDTQKVARARLFGLDEQETQIPTDEQIEILELIGDVTVDGEVHQGTIAAVGNRKVLCQFEAENPYWCHDALLLWATYDDLWFTGIGKGPLEPVRGIQSLIDTFSCQKADELNLILSGCWKYVDDGILDIDTLYLKPGGGIAVGQIQNLVPLQPNQSVTLAYGEIELLRQRGERSTGASRMDMGQAQGGRKTAYETAVIQQGGSGRQMDVARHLANDLMEPILEKYLIDVQQFKYGLGEIEDEALLGEYRVKYLGANMTAMRQYEIQQLMLFTDITARNPVSAQSIKWPGYNKRVLKILNIKDPDEIVMNDQEYQAALRQQQAAEQQSPRRGEAGMMGPAEPFSSADLAAVYGGGR